MYICIYLEHFIALQVIGDIQLHYVQRYREEPFSPIHQYCNNKLELGLVPKETFTKHFKRDRSGSDAQIEQQ